MVKTKLGDFSIIVIFQYGKVGSASIGVNLCKWLDTNFVGTTMRKRTNYPKVTHIHSVEILQDILEKYAKMKKRVLVINSCRNLYQRHLSAYFQKSKNKQKIKTLPPKKLVKDFKENFKIGRLNNWYNDLEGLLDLKLTPFDYKKHYSLSEREGLSLLIVRLEDSKHWEKVFTKVVSPQISMRQKANISSTRWYNDKYAGFKKLMKYSEEDAKTIEESDTHKLFYEDLAKMGLNLFC